MIKKSLFWLPFFAVFFVSYGVLYYNYSLYDSENMIYVPLNKEKTVMENNKVYLSFKLAIPVKKTNSYGGKAVIYVNSFKVASFVRLAKTGEKEKDLSFGEQFLQYDVYRKSGFESSAPSLYIAQRFYTIPESWEKDSLPNLNKIRYAAYLTDKKTGKAVLIGLTDRNFVWIKPYKVKIM